jgi:hypothetical protein
MIGGLVAAVLFAAGIPVLIGLVAWDVSAARKSEPKAPRVAPSIEHSHEAAARRIYLERGVARAFVIAGGTFWGVATFAGMYYFAQTGMGAAVLGAFIPFFATLVTLVVGWYYERTTSVMLFLASVGVVLWGVTHQFELGVWAITTIAMIGPMLTASVLFWLARRDQKALDLSLAAHPELALASVRSERTFD